MVNRIVQGAQSKRAVREMSASWVQECPKDEQYWHIL